VGISGRSVLFPDEGRAPGRSPIASGLEARAPELGARASGTETMEAFGKVCPRCALRYDAAASFCQKDGASLRLLDEEVDERIGQVLLDQLRIEERIGAGGMGAVYRARQTTLGRDVAIKILHPDLARNPDAVRRFHREARISTALDHPNVVRVFLFGQLADGSLYLVMEMLRGRTLAEMLRVEGHLPVHRALHIATQAADGIGEAHVQGIVHRDVKPENVFLITKGRDPDFVKVLDFGIARVVRGEDQTSATQSGLVFGTARYISPEGAAGESTDARSDVYSLGVMTYQLLCGETPFDAASPVTLLMKHIHDPPPHIRSRSGGQHVPDAIADVVMRALTKNAEGRYDDAAEFAEVLRGAAQRAGLDVVRSRASVSGLSSATGSDRRDPTGPAIRERGSSERGASQRGASVPRTVMMQETHAPGGSGGGGGTLENAPSPFAESTGELDSIPGSRRFGGGRSGRRASPVVTVAIAFVIGAVAVGSGVWAVQAVTRPDPAVVEAEALVSRAEAALAQGHYDAPPDDSVRALTERLLHLRPDHPDAIRIRRSAFERLLAEAAEAEGARDRAAALDRYRRALVFVEDEPRAQAAIARIEQEQAVPPRVAGIGVAPDPRAGEPVMLTATIAEDVTLERVDRPRFVIVRGQRRIAGPIVAAPGATPGTWSASYVFTAAGRHRIKFVGGEDTDEDQYQLTTEIDVARGARTPQPRVADDPPVTTQGAYAPVTHPPTIVDVPPPPREPRVATARFPAIGGSPDEGGDPPPPILPLAPRDPEPPPAPPPDNSDPPPPPSPWSSGGT
jgi:serine/threonine protein kinase